MADRPQVGAHPPRGPGLRRRAAERSRSSSRSGTRPNSAGIVIDAVRCCKLALNHGVGGQLDGPSSYLMKSPHNQRPDDEAREATEKFIAKYTRRHAPKPRHAEAPAGASRARKPPPRPADAHGAGAAREQAPPLRRRVTPPQRRRASAKPTRRARTPRSLADRPAFASPRSRPTRGRPPHEVNALRRSASPSELAARGHRVVIVAPSQLAASSCATRAPRRCAATRARCSPRRGEPPRARRRRGAPPSPARRRRGRAAVDVTRTIEDAAQRADASTSATSTSRSRPASPAPRCATRAR